MRLEHPMTKVVKAVLDELDSDLVVSILTQYARTRMLPMVMYSLGDIRDVAISEGATRPDEVLPRVVASGTWKDEMMYHATVVCEQHLRAAVRQALDK